MVLLIVCVAAAFVLKNLFPALAKLMFWLLGIAALLVAALVVLLLVLVFRKNKNSDGTKTVGERPEEILARGRRNVLEIRKMAMRIKNEETRQLCGNICDTADKILRTLKEQPEDIPDVRKFFNYYLPTLGSLMTRYAGIEQSGVPNEELTASALSCLKDIDKAMDKQYRNLFNNDIFDLTVDMELMTMMCRRDGLLDGSEQDGEKGGGISLTL